MLYEVAAPAYYTFVPPATYVRTYLHGYNQAKLTTTATATATHSKLD